MRNLKKNEGITLIALVVTIIVLLILAGISISMLTGNNGILTQANRAKENTRGGEVKETVNLTASENQMSDYTSGTKKTRAELIQELYKAEKLTKKEVEELENTDIITIGDIKVDFSVLGSALGTTLGEVYTDDMIGQKLTYTSNGQSDWIVFGKDKNGNILITTELPIDEAFDLYGSAEKWLSYENDLKNVCSVYGGTIQGKAVTSRSITMEDINYVAGFTKPKFETYTFGSEYNYYDEKKVNYYYPSLEAASNDYWQNPADKAETFDNDWYGYFNNWNSGEYIYYGADTDGNNIDATTRNIRTEKCKYIWGGNTNDTCYHPYLVASRSVHVNSGRADFHMAFVGGDEVGANFFDLCYSNENGCHDYDEIGSFGVRPVVVLPSNLLVVELENGDYDLDVPN